MARPRRRHTCRNCEQRKALFSINGRWKADRQHELCTRCYRSVQDRVNSAQIRPVVYDIARLLQERRQVG